MKTTLILTLLGALTGILLVSWIVPPTLAWYTTPGGLPQGAQIQAVVQIPEVIRYATGKLLHWQVIGAGTGGALGLGLGVVLAIRRRLQRRDAQATAKVPVDTPSK